MFERQILDFCVSFYYSLFMKYIVPVFVLSFLLVGCGEKSIEVRPVKTPFDREAKSNPVTLVSEESLVLGTSGGSEIEIYDFAEPSLIKSPLTLEGFVPSEWVFEGVFPVTLLTNRGEVVKEWYAEANLFDAEGNLVEGGVEFTLDMEFETPSVEDVEFGKLRFAKDIVEDDETEDLVEIKVLFE